MGERLCPGCWRPVDDPGAQTCTRPHGTVALRCSGCDWQARVATRAALDDAARRHDDSPHPEHIVTLDPPRRWPDDDDAFDALRTAEHRPPSARG